MVLSYETFIIVSSLNSDLNTNLGNGFDFDDRQIYLYTCRWFGDLFKKESVIDTSLSPLALFIVTACGIHNSLTMWSVRSYYGSVNNIFQKDTIVTI